MRTESMSTHGSMQANVLKHDTRVSISLFRTYKQTAWQTHIHAQSHTQLKSVFVLKNRQTYPPILMINWKWSQNNPTSTKPWRHKVKPWWLWQHVQLKLLKIEVFNSIIKGFSLPCQVKLIYTALFTIHITNRKIMILIFIIFSFHIVTSCRAW